MGVGRTLYSSQLLETELVFRELPCLCLIVDKTPAVSVMSLYGRDNLTFLPGLTYFCHSADIWWLSENNLRTTWDGHETGIDEEAVPGKTFTEKKNK